MTQQRLQGEDIAATAKIGDGEGVPKPVRMTLFDPRPHPQPLDQMQECRVVHRPFKLTQKQRQFGIITLILTADEVGPNCPPSRLAEEDGATFAALGPTCHAMFNHDAASLHVSVAGAERTQLRRSQTGIDQSQDNGQIALGSRPAHAEFAAVGGFGLFRVFSRFEQQLKLLATKWLDGCTRGFG